MESKPYIINYIFDAPRDRVWKAWTDPEMIRKWWGPKNFSAPEIKVDLRPGGKYLYCMRGKAGPDTEVKDYWSGGTFRKIVPEKKIELTDYFTDETGNKVEPAKYGMDKNFPGEMQLTVKFEDYNDPIRKDGDGKAKTKLTIRYASPKSADEYNAMVKSGMDAGWHESLDKFAESLKIN